MLHSALLMITATAALESQTPPPLRKLVQVRELERCEDGEDLAFVVLTTRLDMIGRAKMALNAVGAARRRIQKPNKMQLKMFKCRSFIEPDTCEYYIKIPYKNPIDKMFEKNKMWTRVVESISPPISFPIKKGRYTMRNATLQFDNQYVDNSTDFDGFYWKIQIDMFLDTERLFCVVIGAEIVQIKIRQENMKYPRRQ